MANLQPERNANGRLWTIEELTPARSHAYRRPGHPAPRFQANGPRAATEEILRAKVRAADWI